MNGSADSSHHDLVVDEHFRLAPDPLGRPAGPDDRPGSWWRDHKAFEVHAGLKKMLFADHAVDLCLARLLRLMGSCSGFRALGHRSMGDYVTQELRQASARRFQYLAAIDRAISERPLPRLGGAWRRGEITFSVARLLVQVATPDNESAWLQTARAMTVSRLQVEVKRALRESREFRPRVAVVAPEDDPEPWRRLAFAATGPVDAAWQVFLETSRRMAGFDIADHACVDDMLAEYTSGCTLLPDNVPARGADPASGAEAGESDAERSGSSAASSDDGDSGARDAWHHARHVTRSAGEDLEILRSAGRASRLAADPLCGLNGGDPPDPQDLHTRIRWVLRVQQRIAWHQMRLARVMADGRLYRRLGFGSMSQYAEQALGVASRCLWSLVTLGRAMGRHPKVEQAFACGEVTALEAMTVCRVARPGTQGDWLARARSSTLQQLREDVAFVLAVEDDTGLPPRREVPDGMAPCSQPEAARLWRGVGGAGRQQGEDGSESNGSNRDIAGESVPSGAGRYGDARAGCRRREAVAPPFCSGRTSATSATTAAFRADRWYAMFGDDPSGVARMLLTSMGSRRPIVFVAPESIACQWNLTLQDCRRRMADLAGAGFSSGCITDSQAVAILLLNFLGQWATPQMLKASRALKTFTRDGWRCQAPGCRSRSHLNAHHIIYRSRNGPDDAWNLVTVCRAHHEMLHAGLIRVRGRAPRRLLWAMGVGAGESVRERYYGGTRVEVDTAWRTGRRRRSVRAPDDWREACEA